MYLQEDVNEYGTPVSQFVCDFCGKEFTVCPKVEPEDRNGWNGCLDVECESYDIDRDASFFFALGMVEVDDA